MLAILFKNSINKCSVTVQRNNVAKIFQIQRSTIITKEKIDYDISVLSRKLSHVRRLVNDVCEQSESQIEDNEKASIKKKKKKKKVKKNKSQEETDFYLPNETINFDENNACDDIIFDLNLKQNEYDLIEGKYNYQRTTDFSSFASSFSSTHFNSSTFPAQKRPMDENQYEFNESQIAKRNLQSFIHVCIIGDNLEDALPIFLNFLSKYSRSWHSADIESCFELLVKGWARKGSTENVIELLRFIKNDLKLNLNVNFYEYYLLSMSKQTIPPTRKDIDDVINDMKMNDISPEQLFKYSTLSHSEILSVKRFLRDYDVYIFYRRYRYPRIIDNVHLQSILSQEQQLYEPFKGIENLCELLDNTVQKQFMIEKNFHEKIPPIKANFYDTDMRKPVEFYKKKIRQFEDQWREALSAGFKSYLKRITNKQINGIPFRYFMTILDEEAYVNMMLDEIRGCALFSEFYSPYSMSLFESLGTKIMQQYLLKSNSSDQTLQDFSRCYKQYIEYLKNPHLLRHFNPREYWYHLLENGYHYYFDDTKFWSKNICKEIGKDLYELIAAKATFDLNSLGFRNKYSHDTKKKNIQPVLGLLYKGHEAFKARLDICVHPMLIRFYDGAESDIYFEPERLPMLCPPVPWVSPSFGGNLLTRNFLVRSPPFFPKNRFKKYPATKMFPTYDSLNALGLCPWKINKQILDLAIHIFSNKGNLQLDIPTTLSSFPALPKFTDDLTPKERDILYMKKKQLKKEQSEMYSLWADCQYKLSISNYLRDKIFWFPINADFRSRVYPIPPNFNHLGSDLSRALLLFAKGKPLGKDGLRWLKIHLINLTGFKKRCTTADRLKYCEDNIDLIMDSADNPLTGKKWWMDSDEKWQTLACCIELTTALRSSDPENHISHLPIHQDGSCNGLQHYAALGRDVLGAKSVNLAPSEIPQDVYSDVAALVELDIEKDSQNNNEIAQAVKGHINRKIVKQTVMTYVYGVTRYGAKLQVLKRLKENPNFPEAQNAAASVYISGKILESIRKMFTQTRVIQDWLTNCAQIISDNYGSSVEWITPIGFPVIQSYYKDLPKSGHIKLRPNPMKQKNAFPANFIHSLDSTHMMLTSLECHRNGLTFASVHDCYWTHACDVDQMNLFCRRQFVALHSEPILDELSDYLRDYVEKLNKDFPVQNHEQFIRIIHQRIPKGEFDLRLVLDSEFFFS